MRLFKSRPFLNAFRLRQQLDRRQERFHFSSEKKTDMLLKRDNIGIVENKKNYRRNRKNQPQTVKRIHVTN